MSVTMNQHLQTLTTFKELSAMSIFIQNKYYSWYYSIINSAKNQSRKRLKRNNPLYIYYEKHHIIPKSLSGSNDKDNLVLLTAREHFICHILLTKFIIPNSSNYHKMIRAAHNMIRNSKTQDVRYINSRLYQTIRSEFCKTQSISQSGKGNSQYGKSKSSTHIAKTKHKFLIKYGITKKFNICSKISKSLHKHYQNINQLLEYYDLYNTIGWKAFVKTTKYPYSQPNLVNSFKSHLKNFNPQNGKRRG